VSDGGEREDIFVILSGAQRQSKDARTGQRWGADSNLVEAVRPSTIRPRARAQRDPGADAQDDDLLRLSTLGIEEAGVTQQMRWHCLAPPVGSPG
jgi:hypothetical protein